VRLTSAILALALVLPAQAQQSGSTITLSCNGKSKLAVTPAETPTAELKVTDLGIIVDAANRTVHVLGLRDTDHEPHRHTNRLQYWREVVADYRRVDRPGDWPYLH
jgi:hypothetical protein